MLLTNKPVNVIPPKSVPVVVAKTDKELCTLKIQAILKEYDNMESNIPVNHTEYWNLLKDLRGMK